MKKTQGKVLWYVGGKKICARKQKKKGVTNLAVSRMLTDFLEGIIPKVLLLLLMAYLQTNPFTNDIEQRMARMRRKLDQRLKSPRAEMILLDVTSGPLLASKQEEAPQLVECFFEIVRHEEVCSRDSVNDSVKNSIRFFEGVKAFLREKKRASEALTLMFDFPTKDLFFKRLFMKPLTRTPSVHLSTLCSESVSLTLKYFPEHHFQESRDGFFQDSSFRCALLGDENWNRPFAEMHPMEFFLYFTCCVHIDLPGFYHVLPYLLSSIYRKLSWGWFVMLARIQFFLCDYYHLNDEHLKFLLHDLDNLDDAVSVTFFQKYFNPVVECFEK